MPELHRIGGSHAKSVCWPLSPLLISLLVISLLELAESILQASDLGLLLVQHHDKTWVQLPLQHLLILNLLLQPGEKKHTDANVCAKKLMDLHCTCLVCLSSESSLVRRTMLMPPPCADISHPHPPSLAKLHLLAKEWISRSTTTQKMLFEKKSSTRDIKWKTYKWIIC